MQTRAFLRAYESATNTERAKLTRLRSEAAGKRSRHTNLERSGSMSRLDDLIAATKLNEIVNKKEEDKTSKTILWGLAIVGAVAAIAAIAYAVYCFFTPDYLEDFEEDFEEDFDADFFNEEDQV